MPPLDIVPVPASAGAFVHLSPGDELSVVDVEGGQVGDLFALVEGDDGEHLSAQHTRAVNDRLFPRLGQSFVTNRRRPILTLIEDTSPGVHDMLIAACDLERYTGLGVDGWHASCAENYLTTAKAAGADPAFVPQSVNLFMSIPWDADGELSWEPATTAPGDAIRFRAEVACLVVVSACPQDIVVINNGQPTPLQLETARA